MEMMNKIQEDYRAQNEFLKEENARLTISLKNRDKAINQVREDLEKEHKKEIEKWSKTLKDSDKEKLNYVNNFQSLEESLEPVNAILHNLKYGTPPVSDRNRFKRIIQTIFVEQTAEDWNRLIDSMYLAYKFEKVEVRSPMGEKVTFRNSVDVEYNYYRTSKKYSKYFKYGIIEIPVPDRKSGKVIEYIRFSFVDFNKQNN